jgi:hypothetical protein
MAASPSERTTGGRVGGTWWSKAIGIAKEDLENLEGDNGWWCRTEVVVNPAERHAEIVSLANALFHNWLRECVESSKGAGGLQLAGCERKREKVAVVS